MALQPTLSQVKKEKAPLCARCGVDDMTFCLHHDCTADYCRVWHNQRTLMDRPTLSHHVGMFVCDRCIRRDERLGCKVVWNK